MQKYQEIIDTLIVKLSSIEIQEWYDISDLGNDIGIVLGKYTELNSHSPMNKENFITGIRHGISLSDGTH